MRIGGFAAAGAGAAAVLAAVTACASAGSSSPVAAGSPSGSARSAAPSPSVSASVAPSVVGTGTDSKMPAIPDATLRAVVGGHQASINAVSSPGSVLTHAAQSEQQATRTALAQEPRGSQVLGLTLARVKGFGFGADMSQTELVWLASVDPFGSSYVSGNPACGRLSFVVEFIDPGTGHWLMTASGKQSGLAPLPQLGPTPTLAQPSPSCAGPAPHMHLGTPAAN